eukprot:GHVU01142300.1.p1 GENE.GHVU01142300.1~~GHVU01142300.1.p1  ORF type:complete len:305 (-),score=38.77 GHVU01142300.1:877-1791(-)
MEKLRSGIADSGVFVILTNCHVLGDSEEGVQFSKWLRGALEAAVGASPPFAEPTVALCGEDRFAAAAPALGKVQHVQLGGLDAIAAADLLRRLCARFAGLTAHEFDMALRVHEVEKQLETTFDYAMLFGYQIYQKRLVEAFKEPITSTTWENAWTVKALAAEVGVIWAARKSGKAETLKLANEKATKEAAAMADILLGPAPEPSPLRQLNDVGHESVQVSEGAPGLRWQPKKKPEQNQPSRGSSRVRGESTLRGTTDSAVGSGGNSRGRPGSHRGGRRGRGAGAYRGRVQYQLVAPGPGLAAPV